MTIELVRHSVAEEVLVYPDFDDELATLMKEIRHHIEDEEGEMFKHMRDLATGRGSDD